MTPKLLKETMKKAKKSTIDISAATRIHPITIGRYLRGKNIHPSLELALSRWIEDQKGKK